MAPDPNAPNTLSLAFSEDLYASWREDPDSVPANWRAYFASLSLGESITAADAAVVGQRQLELAERQNKVDRLIRNYRVRAHNIADVNPLAPPPAASQELALEYYGFSDSDLDLPFSAGSLAAGEVLPLREILRLLRATYTRSIGVQFMHIDDIECRRWLYRRMEGCENRIDLPLDHQIDILTRLTDAALFEEFIQKKYTGAKSFSLEGAESLIPLLAQSIEYAGSQGIEDIILGMPHRGRLNVLANIMGKSPGRIFAEFEDRESDLYLGHGDVKYHKGHHCDWTCRDGRTVHLALCFNPSHLEFVNPVAVGRVRAKQDRLDDIDHSRGMAILIHGDAAFIGEGIVQETLNLSELAGYSTGGTLHVVVNNQIGFTTLPQDARSTRYCTDVAKMLQIPIFHVNGEDPEAVAQAVTLALDYRHEFGRDVVIDMLCYRRRGHNESDEPAFTQPLLYEQIRRRKPVRESYLEHLVKLGQITHETADRIAAERRAALDACFAEVHDQGLTDQAPIRRPVTSVVWRQYTGGPESVVPDVLTGVPRDLLRDLLRRLATIPEGFTPHRKLLRLLDSRRRMAEGEAPLDWSAAETLAMASLAVAGHRVRLSGQDSERGTFSHRHAVLHDVHTGTRHIPLQHVGTEQAMVEIYNSPLSEAGVLGFEYGYSLSAPDALVMWEAQFGDFVNAAQVILDQFLASAEAKWRFLSGLVLLLPHGFEGMGPEHSSARLERFLHLAAEDNLQIAQPTTPAQLFHLLRRQVIRPWRKPLIVLSPKSMLRSPEVVSSLDDLAQGGFQRIIPDPRREEGTDQQVREILACSGKIYFELEGRRRQLGRDDLHILRFEQLYPLPAAYVQAMLDGYRLGTPVRWIQEEPENQGAWPYLRYRFGEQLPGGHPLRSVCRPVAASPATGSSSSHKLERQLLLERVFGP